MNKHLAEYSDNLPPPQSSKIPSIYQHQSQQNIGSEASLPCTFSQISNINTSPSPFCARPSSQLTKEFQTQSSN